MQLQIVKNGTVVDAECPLQEIVHVWKDENGFFFQLSQKSCAVEIDTYLIFYDFLPSIWKFQ